MRNSIKILTIGSMLISLVTVAAAEPAATYDHAKEVLLPEEQKDFFNVNEAFQFANAYGDREKGAHGTFGRFPANFITPSHIHSSEYHAIVLHGVMTNPFEGEENPVKLRAGSYWFVPAGANHATACISEEPCEFFMYSEASFDFIKTP